MRSFTINKRQLSFEEVCKRVPEGWSEVLKEGFDKMFSLGWGGEIIQIKEKFGSLRLYLSDVTDDITKVKEDMEKKTRQVCCVCGSVRTKTSSGWVLHYCDKHFPKDNKELEGDVLRFFI